MVRQDPNRSQKEVDILSLGRHEPPHKPEHFRGLKRTRIFGAMHPNNFVLCVRVSSFPNLGLDLYVTDLPHLASKH